MLSFALCGIWNAKAFARDMFDLVQLWQLCKAAAWEGERPAARRTPHGAADEASSWHTYEMRNNISVANRSKTLRTSTSIRAALTIYHFWKSSNRSLRSSVKGIAWKAFVTGSFSTYYLQKLVTRSKNSSAPSLSSDRHNANWHKITSMRD